jgi:serine protease AprX
MNRTLRNSTRQIARTAVIWLALMAIMAGSALGNNSKISPDLQALLNDSSTQVNVIVQYNSQQSTSCSGGLLGDLLCPVLNLVGGVVNDLLGVINGVAASMSIGDVVNTSNQSNVSYISLDRPVRPMLDYTAAAVDAQYAWSAGFDGTGVGIAIIDSGIYPHQDLNAKNSNQSRIVYRQSFVKGGILFDDYGHGTHVAGIAASNGNSSDNTGAFRTFKGIAPNANLIDLRVLNASGESSDSLVIAAIQQAIQLKNKYNIRVINLSLGRPIFESCTIDPLCRAVQAAWQNGIVVVTAAGNLGRDGYSTILSPGNSPYVITVGCMKTMGTYPVGDDRIASYSSRGPTFIDMTVKPDLVAPGNLVDSLLAPGSALEAAYPGNIVRPSAYTTAPVSGGPYYFTLSGTSMATPVVSGSVALMLQKDPQLTPDTVKARLMKTADKNFPVSSTVTDPTTGDTYIDFYDILTVGAGYVNVASVLQNNETITSTALSPQVEYNSLLLTAYLVPNWSSAWWTGSDMSTSAVWGSNVLLPAGIRRWRVVPRSGEAQRYGAVRLSGAVPRFGEVRRFGEAPQYGEAPRFGVLR